VREQLLPQVRAVGEGEAADRADLDAGAPVLDLARRDEPAVPGGKAVEVADAGPDIVGGRVDHGAGVRLGHRASSVLVVGSASLRRPRRARFGLGADLGERLARRQGLRVDG
jgi:hypothetical protein